MEENGVAPFVKVLNRPHQPAGVMDLIGCTRVAVPGKMVSTQTTERVFATFKEHMNLQTLSQLIDQRGGDPNKKDEVDENPPESAESEQVQCPVESTGERNRGEKGSNIRDDVALSLRKIKKAIEATSAATMMLTLGFPLVVAKKVITKKQNLVETTVATNTLTLVSPAVKIKPVKRMGWYCHPT